MYLLTIGLLVFIAVASGIVVFHPNVKDNFMQRCGMSLLALGSLAIAYRAWTTQWISNSEITFIVGAVLYFIGTYRKVNLSKGHNIHGF